jgi:hypothetical protein
MANRPQRSQYAIGQRVRYSAAQLRWQKSQGFDWSRERGTVVSTVALPAAPYWVLVKVAWDNDDQPTRTIRQEHLQPAPSAA